ncbi:MAG: Fis family transcriptional regulator [Ferrovum sp.]|jgi:Fis family transcriptional regulator|nr:Fis family transcriptional regulator [Ferrovum sp.]NDU86874.1 Fis family transcriptional regulator [Ferrovum sp.]
MNAPETDLSACIRRMVKEYFHHLEGERCSSLHEMVLNSVEKPLIDVVLAQCDNNQTRAAEILGMNRTTLRKKMQRYQLL